MIICDDKSRCEILRVLMVDLDLKGIECRSMDGGTFCWF